MNNKSKQALKYFRGSEGYNCAQAIVKVFEDNPEILQKLKKYGGGRAPNNMCGALYAALYLLDDDIKSKEILSNDFKKQAGHIACREIRKSGKTPCRECVRIAAELVGEHKKT